MKKDFCAFTIVQNETLFLDLWAKYYSKYIDKCDIFILNHNTTLHESNIQLSFLKSQGFNVIPIHRSESFNHKWLRETVQNFQSFLLQSYDVVLFAECDELLIVNEKYKGGLSEYLLAEKNQPLKRCCGYELVHYKDEEPSLYLGSSPLKQRSFWHRECLYDKPLITNQKVNWEDGFHNIEGFESEINTDLFLVHLHRIDYNLCKLKHEEQAKRKWSQSDLNSNQGFQNRLFYEEEFNKWFYNFAGPRYDLPELIRNAI